MKKLKKVMSVALAGILAFGMCGCGKKKEETKKKASSGEKKEERAEKNSGASFDMSNVNVGDTVTIGKYEWIVLAKNDTSAYVITKDIIEFLSYDPYMNDPEKMGGSITWETSAVRKWLNEDFINTCFSEEEQSMILETMVVTADNPKYGTSGGNDTKDKLFIMEYDEVMKYFETDEARKAVAPANPEHSSYFLRTPGREANMVMNVAADGKFVKDEAGQNVWYTSGIRPVMWIAI